MGITLTLVEQVGLPGKMGTSSFTSVLLHSTWLLCVCTYLGIKFLGKALQGFLSAPGQCSDCHIVNRGEPLFPAAIMLLS